MALVPWNAEAERRHRRRNLMQSLVLLGGMVGLLSLCGWILAGGVGMLWALLAGGLSLMLSPRLSPGLVLRLYRARPLPAYALPDLHQVLAEIARRAGLSRPPALYYVPSPVLNAFAVGDRADCAIALTDAMLRAFTLRELAGVLAHEVSHIRHGDLWVMGLADTITRVTRTMALFGILLLAINLPVVIVGAVEVPWLLVATLMAAPTLGALLQLALARTREFDADLDAAGLTGDAVGLATALDKMERWQARGWESILLPGRRAPDPSLLRTHPETAERVRRLLELQPHLPELLSYEPIRILLPDGWTAVRRRWHLPGSWL